MRFGARGAGYAKSIELTASHASRRSLRPERSAKSRRTAAMLAEAAHSLADTTNQAFLVFSIDLSERPPDDDHPFGSGRERFLWTFVAAVGTFIASAVFAIGWGVYELVNPPAPETQYAIPFAVLGPRPARRGRASWLRARRQTREEARREEMGFGDYVRASRDPNVKMVLFEDSAALIGIGLAALGIGLQAITGIELWDPTASVAIGVLLVVVAIWMARDARHKLVGAAARPDERRAIEEALRDFPEIADVRELLTLILAPNALLVATRVDLADDLDADRIERVSDEIDARLREIVPDVTEVFVDATPP